MDVRPLHPDDVSAAAAVTRAALPPPGPRPRVDGWLERRISHMLTTDPGGAWAAEHEGRVVGLALAIVRDGIWGLSLMAVDPALHARGAGTRLLRAALTHAGDDTRGGIILSSTDPRAMRMYARAGFDLRPAVAFGGIVDRAAIPAGLRSRETGDLEAVARLAVPVRGGAYDPDDLALLLERGDSTTVFTIDGRGFVLCADGTPLVLAADSGGVAADLLWTCFAAGPRGGTVDVDFVTAGQDWAVRACLAAGLAITPDGPVYTRGELGPLRAWLPSGSLL